MARPTREFSQYNTEQRQAHGMTDAADYSFTWNPGIIAQGAQETHQESVEGVQLGDFVLVSCSLDLEDMALTAYVQAAGVVEVVLTNNALQRNLGLATWYLRIFKRTPV